MLMELFIDIYSIKWYLHDAFHVEWIQYIFDRYWVCTICHKITLTVLVL